MSRRGSARADALRRAHATRTDRDAARQLRKAQIESALADYYLAVSLAKRIRDTGRRKARMRPPRPTAPPRLRTPQPPGRSAASAVCSVASLRLRSCAG
jgi:hypothetical protein